MAWKILSNECTQMAKYKIIARSSMDWVEIWPFETFKDALDDLYNDQNFRNSASRIQSKETSIEKQSHPLIKEILSPIK